MLVDMLLFEGKMSDLMLATADNALHTYSPPKYPDSENSPLEFSIPAETIMTTRRDVGILIAGASKLQTPNHFLSNSGVVASAIAYGNSFEAALSQAYALAETFNDFHYRDDIGLRLDVPEVYRS